MCFDLLLSYTADVSNMLPRSFQLQMRDSSFYRFRYHMHSKDEGGKKRVLKGIRSLSISFSLLPVRLAAPLVSKKRNINKTLGGKTVDFVYSRMP